MIVHELRRFGLSTDKYRDIFFDAPSSLAEVLAEAGIVDGVGYEEHCRGAYRLLGGGCTLALEFTPDLSVLAKDSIVLCLKRISAPVTVVVGGLPVANIEANRPLTRLNIKTFLRGGKNRIELRVGAPSSDGEAPDLIIEPMYIEAYNDRVIDALKVRQTVREGGVDVELSLSTVGYGADFHAVATLISPGGSVNYSSFVNGVAKIHISTPSLWWPGALGPHSLYRLSVNLYSNTEVIDSREGTIGIRDLSVNTDACGYSIIKANGAAFAPIGAVLTERDMLSPLGRTERAIRAVKRSALCGLNTVYIKDELPSESLLSACDELGVCVILEISPDIPYDGAARTIELGALSRSLSAYALHPSLAVITSRSNDPDAVGSTVRDVLPDVVFAPEIKLQETKWIPTMPAEATLAEFVPEGEKNIFSPAMVRRTVGDVAALVSGISREHLMPYGTDEIRYISGVVSAADAKCDYLSAIRGEEKRGILIPMLVDPRPYFSPSLIDYRLKPKALWYYLTRLSRNAIASVTVDGTRVEFIAYNLSRNDYKGKLSYALVDTHGATLIRDSVDVFIAPSSARGVLGLDFSELIENRKDNAVLMYTLSGKDGVSYSDTAIFVSERELELHAPNIKYNLTGACNDFTLTLTAEAYARGVEVTFFDEDVLLSDNYFDITPSHPARIEIHSPRPTATEALWNKIKIRSLYDIGRG